MTHSITTNTATPSYRTDTTTSPYRIGKKRSFDSMSSPSLEFITKCPASKAKRGKTLKVARRTLKVSKNTQEKRTILPLCKTAFRPISKKDGSIERKSMDLENQERFSQTCNQIPLKAPIPRGVTPLNTEDYHEFLASMSFLKI